MRNFGKIFFGILVAVIALTVILQGSKIAVLQERIDHLFDELYVTTGVLHGIEYDLDYHIEKCEVQE